MNQPNRILIIKLGALGDVMLALPHIKQICVAHPDAAITVLTAPEYAELVSRQPGVTVRAFKRRGFLEMTRLLIWLRRQQFAVVYDLQGSLRSRIMTRVSAAGKRIGRRPGGVYTHAPAATDEMLHAFTELNRLLEYAGIERAEPRISLDAGDAARQAVARWLQEHQVLDARLALVHAGSSERWLSKRWDEAHFLTLAQLLGQRGYAVIWIGGSDEQELNQRLSSEAGLDASGEFDFMELLALGQCASFAIVNDSGPMHVLSAANIPVYAFFGPTDWQRSHALGQQDRVLTHPVPCSPCHLPVCPPERQHQCLGTISPADIIMRLEKDGLL